MKQQNKRKKQQAHHSTREHGREYTWGLSQSSIRKTVQDGNENWPYHVAMTNAVENK